MLVFFQKSRLSGIEGTYEDKHVASGRVNANPSVLLVSDVKVAASTEEEADLLVSVEMPRAKRSQTQRVSRGGLGT